MGRLSTHVLNTVSGKPAANMSLSLFKINLDHTRTLLCEVCTNQDGRTDRPLLEKDAFGNGTYELIFDVGNFFRNQMFSGQDSDFLDLVTIRFIVNRSHENYHVPLLVSPWSYTTYRGS